MPFYIQYPSWIRPEVFSFLPIRWYAVMYIVAFAVAYLLLSYQIKREKNSQLSLDEWQNLFLVGITGLLIGARLFSVLFYSDGLYYITHPWMIFWPFRNGHFIGLPGMSYHGGVFGAIVADLIYCHRKKVSFLHAADLVTAGLPLGYTFGRIGNFINGELYGRVTTVPWGMVFPTAPSFPVSEEWVREIASRLSIPYIEGGYVNLPRHPSQLYEALFEGVILFLLLWFVLKPLKEKRSLPEGTIFAGYLFGYGFFRFFIEYCRQPDADIGYVIALGSESDNIALFQSFLNISKGQVFCLIMMVCAVILYIQAKKIQRREASVVDRRKNKRTQK